MSCRIKKLTIVFACVLVTYVGSYLCLSQRGRYEPIAFDLHGVMWFSWAPQGFVHQPKAEWRPALMYAYLPMLILDWKLWHRNIEPGEKTNYPMDELFQRG